MFYKASLSLIFLFTVSGKYCSATTLEMIEALAKAKGVEFTPKKTARIRIQQGGLGVINEILVEQAQQKEKLREEGIARKLAFVQEEEANKRAVERAKAELEIDQLKQHEVIKRDQERQAHQKLVEDLERTWTEKLQAQKFLMEQAISDAKSLSGENGEAAREIVVEEGVAELQARLQEMEQEKNDLLNALGTLKGGQVLLPTKGTEFIVYGAPYFHTHNLKEPNISLDETLNQKLNSIKECVQTLLDEMEKNAKLKAVQRMLTKRQLERLKAGAEEFDAGNFLRTFNEVKGQLPTMTDSPAFQTIEVATKWIEKNRKALSKVGEHRLYVQRQHEAAQLVQDKMQEFEEFYEDYLDRVVADMCKWLSPTATDGEAIKDLKREFKLKIQKDSIPELKKYLSGSIPIFGTTDSFLMQMFVKCGQGKEFGNFKEVLLAYSALFNEYGEMSKLVEELLNYQFFQKRYQSLRKTLATLDLSQIADKAIREILIVMRDEDVLVYSETKTSIFAAAIPGALKEYIGKFAIAPGENLIVSTVEKILIAYLQIDAFSNSLRAANPKVIDFHIKEKK
ncbi:MAG: hypothetical protein FJX03_05765 [Alphaproteobacteria bacterium]|nr:hypothetical protein [Alphaproteobacteria bacterium]